MTVDEVQQLAGAIRREMARAVIGQEVTIDLLLVSLFAGGHVLLEGPPGTAKTLIARCFAKTLALLLATWLVWMAVSFRVLPFTQGTIALGFALLSALSALVYWRHRDAIGGYADRKDFETLPGLTSAEAIVRELERDAHPSVCVFRFSRTYRSACVSLMNATHAPVFAPHCLEKRKPPDRSLNRPGGCWIDIR